MVGAAHRAPRSRLRGARAARADRASADAGFPVTRATR
jgi:hypothetical protein